GGGRQDRRESPDPDPVEARYPRDGGPGPLRHPPGSYQPLVSLSRRQRATSVWTRPHDLRDFPDTRAVIPRIVERASRLLYETYEVRAPLVHGGVDGREGFLRFRRPPALPRSLGGDARDGVHCDPDYRKSEARL